MQVDKGGKNKCKKYYRLCKEQLTAVKSNMFFSLAQET